MGFWDSLKDIYRESEFKELMEKLRNRKSAGAGDSLEDTFIRAMKDTGKKDKDSSKVPQIVVQAAEKVKVYNPVYAMILLIVGLGAWLLVQYYTPLGKLITFFLQDVIAKYLPEPWPSLIANWLWGYIILVAGAVYLLAHKFSPSALPAFMQNIGMFYLSISIIFFVGYIGYNTFLSSGVFDNLICSGSVALSVINQVDPNAANRCLSKQQAVPPYDKNGIGVLASEQLGGSTGTIPTIFPQELYTLPFTITNLDTQNTISGVYVKGKMSGQIRSNGQLQDKLISFTADSCTSDNPCNILPGGTQGISLQSEEKISFYAPGFTDVTIYTTYPYSGFGKGEVFEAASESDAARIQFPKPQSDPGPVDVVVSFPTGYFLSDTVLDHVTMLVSLVNNGQGDIVAKSLLINRLGTFNQLGPATCMIPKSTDIVNEGQLHEFQNLEFQKGETIQFTCTLSIQLSGTKLSGPYVGIPFTATFAYDYRDTTFQELPIKAI